MIEEENETRRLVNVGLTFEIKSYSFQSFRQFKNSQAVLGGILSGGVIAKNFTRWMLRRQSFIFGILCSSAMFLAFGLGHFLHRQPNQRYGHVCTGIFSFIAACFSVPTIVSYASELNYGSRYHYSAILSVGLCIPIILVCLIEFALVVSWILTLFRINQVDASKQSDKIGNADETTKLSSRPVNVGLTFKIKPCPSQTFKRFKNSQLIFGTTLSVSMLGWELTGWSRDAYCFGVPCSCAMVLAFAFGHLTFRKPSQYGYTCTGILSLIATCLCIPTIVSYASIFDLPSRYSNEAVIASRFMFGTAIILACVLEVSLGAYWIFSFFRISQVNVPKKPVEIGHEQSQALRPPEEGRLVTKDSEDCSNTDNELTH